MWTLFPKSSGLNLQIPGPICTGLYVTMDCGLIYNNPRGSYVKKTQTKGYWGSRAVDRLISGRD
jgi:hypothetical protein